MKQFFKSNYLFVALSIWLFWCCSAMLEWDHAGNLIAHNYSVWGDWSAHLTFISNLLERGPSYLWGDNPVFAGVPFQYPFLSHVTTALVAFLFRLSPIMAIYSTSLILILALPFCLNYFFKSLRLSPIASFIATLLFLFMGGFQYFDSSLLATEPLTNQFARGSVFTQFVAFEFFPQRAFLFGLIVFTLVAGSLVRKLFEAKITRKSLIYAGLAIAFSAWLHLHTWIAFATLLACYFLTCEQAQRRKAFVYGLAVAAASLPLIAFLLLRGHAEETKQGWTWFFPGWAQNKNSGLAGPIEMNFISFWILNTGLFIPLSVAGVILSKHRKELRFVWGAAALLFMVALVFNLQPYFYDNLKVFTYSFLFLAPFAAISIETLMRKRYLAPFTGILVCLQCYAGFKDLDFLRSGKQNATFFTAEEFSLSQDFKKLRSDANELVLIQPRHNHWVPCLSGNPVVMGYPGWLWSWGIQYRERETMINSVLLAKPGWVELIKKENISYLVINQNDLIENQPPAIEAFNSQFQQVLAQGNWKIYSTKSPSISVRK